MIAKENKRNKVRKFDLASKKKQKELLDTWKKLADKVITLSTRPYVEALKMISGETPLGDLLDIPKGHRDLINLYELEELIEIVTGVREMPDRLLEKMSRIQLSSRVKTILNIQSNTIAAIAEADEKVIDCLRHKEEAIESAVQDLRALYNVYGKDLIVLSEDPAGNYFVFGFRTNPISFGNRRFGKFTVGYSQPGNFGSPIAIAATPNYAAPTANIGVRTLTHPHVSNNLLCTGDVGNQLISHMKTGQFLDAAELLRLLITTYDPPGAYKTLEEWKDSKGIAVITCHICGEREIKAHSYVCRGCSSVRTKKYICNLCYESPKKSYACHTCGVTSCYEEDGITSRTTRVCDVCGFSGCSICEMFTFTGDSKESTFVCNRCLTRNRSLGQLVKLTNTPLPGRKTEAAWLSKLLDNVNMDIDPIEKSRETLKILVNKIEQEEKKEREAI